MEKFDNKIIEVQQLNTKKSNNMNIIVVQYYKEKSIKTNKFKVKYKLCIVDFQAKIIVYRVCKSLVQNIVFF